MFDWQEVEIKNIDKITFIHNFEIFPLQLNISFKRTAYSNTNEETFFVWNILKAVGIVLTNIDDAPIKLNGFRLEECSSAASGVFKKIASHYRENSI